MAKFLYRSYAAIGDSLSEGLGDVNFEQNRLGAGWADRFAGLLAAQAKRANEPFEFANLSVRGSKMLEILTSQLEDTLKIRPDLVTIMAGSNDIMRPESGHAQLAALLRGGIKRLLDSGCQVVVVNVINPCHLQIFKPMARRATRLSNLLDTIAGEFDVPVLDVQSVQEFARLEYWGEDMVHFSQHGHTKVANLAAELVGLDFRLNEVPEDQMEAPDRSFFGTLRWLQKWVLPFLFRRITRRSSGDGVNPKHFELEPFAPAFELDGPGIFSAPALRKVFSK